MVGCVGLHTERASVTNHFRCVAREGCVTDKSGAHLGVVLALGASSVDPLRRRIPGAMVGRGVQ